MFSATLQHTEHFGAALKRCAGVLLYQPTPYPVIALEGTDAAFMVASTCDSDQRLRLADNAVQTALTLLNQGTSPLWIVETASGITFAASAPPESPDSPSFGGAGAFVPDRASSPLDSLVRKAQAFGSPVVRVGMSSLQFNIGVGQWALVELLPDQTFVSIYHEGQLKSRREFPALSAFALLRAVPFDSMLL